MISNDVVENFSIEVTVSLAIVLSVVGWLG